MYTQTSTYPYKKKSLVCRLSDGKLFTNSSKQTTEVRLDPLAPEALGIPHTRQHTNHLTEARR